MEGVLKTCDLLNRSCVLLGEKGDVKSEGGGRGEDPSQVKEEQHIAAEDLRKDQTFLNDAGKQSTPVEDHSSKNEQTSTTQPTTENIKTKVTQIIKV